MLKKLIIRSIFIVFLSGGMAIASPREVAESFLNHIFEMEIRQATALIAEPDYSAQTPLGRYSRFVNPRPRFPSQWKSEVLFVDEREDTASVGVVIIYPEIEESLRRTSSPALEELALQHYLEGNLEMARIEIEVSLVALDTGLWRVQTFADENDWWSQRRFPPEADIVTINREQILTFQNQLMEKFPHRAEEISELVDPQMAILDAAAGLIFSNLNVVDDRMREQPLYREPVYDVSLNVTNGSQKTIDYISGQFVFRDSVGVIIETSGFLLSDKDVPHGLKPNEIFYYASGRIISNVNAPEVSSVEVQVHTVRVK